MRNLRSTELKLGSFVAISVMELLACFSANAAEPVECMPSHESFQIASSSMMETRTVNVYLPPGYADDAAATFPVLYVLDGGIQEDFPHVASTIDRAIGEGTMRPVILVGIENTQRRRDMTGPTLVESDREIAPVVGGSAAFRKFIKAELFARVAASYRVSEARGVIGESLAGLFVVETFALDRAMFDTYIAISPSLWWNAGQLARDVPGTIAAHASVSRLYLAAADEDNIVPRLRVLGETIRELVPDSVALTVHEYPTLAHSTIYRAIAPTVLRKLYPPIREAPTSVPLASTRVAPR